MPESYTKPSIPCEESSKKSNKHKARSSVLLLLLTGVGDSTHEIILAPLGPLLARLGFHIFAARRKDFEKGDILVQLGSILARFGLIFLLTGLPSCLMAAYMRLLL